MRTRPSKWMQRLEEVAEAAGFQFTGNYLAYYYLTEGCSLRQISEMIGCSHETTRTLLLHFKIPLRPARSDKPNFEGAEIPGTLKAVSQQTGIPMSTLYHRRKRLREAKQINKEKKP